MALALLGAACAASYRLWFMPALAQIERDRHTLEGLIATLGKPARAPHAGASLAPSASPPLEAKPALSPAPLRPPKSIVHAQRPLKRVPEQQRCDARDPLCGDLDL